MGSVNSFVPADTNCESSLVPVAPIYDWHLPAHIRAGILHDFVGVAMSVIVVMRMVMAVVIVLVRSHI